MLKRILIFALGLTSLSLGIALITNAHLGTSSISSFAYVLSMGTGLTMGLFVFLTNVFFFCVQTAIDPTQVLLKAVKQLPICALFGLVIDVAMKLTTGLSAVAAGSWFAGAAMVLCGCVFVGFGISGMVFSRLAYLPPEGAVLAVMKRWGGSFGTLRLGVDVFIVISAVLASLLFFGEIRGLREGTVAAALISGPTAKFLLHGWGRLMPHHGVID